jgi:hypothetical protein
MPNMANSRRRHKGTNPAYATKRRWLASIWLGFLPGPRLKWITAAAEAQWLIHSGSPQPAIAGKRRLH